jgi:prepilin-type N-terminal cleavage/methylation domain-containing protein
VSTHAVPTGEVDHAEHDEDAGFTLIEILIAIVLVGILSAVAVVGISNLVSKGSTSACTASADAAKAASAVYFASNSRYPVSLTELTAPGSTGAPLALPSGVNVNTAVVPAAAPNPGAAIGMQASGAGWFLTMSPGTGTGAAPTFACN